MKQKGFEQLLEETHAKVTQLEQPLEVIDTMLTLDGKIPLEIARQSLNFEQWAIYQHLVHAKCVFTDEQSINPKQVISFGMSAYGRLHLGPSFNDDYTKVWGYFLLTPEAMTEIEKLTTHLHREELLRYQSEVVPFFRHIEPQDVLQVIDAIKEKVDFMAPVLLYYNGHTYTTFYHYNNLLKSLEGDTAHFLLDDLAKKNKDAWTRDERIFIFNLYTLLQSGPPARGEEVNGVHFSLHYLSRYLDGKLAIYHGMTDTPSKPVPKSLLAKARLICQLREKVAENYVIYRKINGLNLHKQEQFLNQQKVGLYHDEAMENELAQILRMTPEETHQDAFINYIAQHPDITVIQTLLEKMLGYAIRATDSDVGMTRGFRQPWLYNDALKHHQLETIFEWKQQFYFCCAIPSDKMKQAFLNQGQKLAGILTAISKRMEYNSWHYTPGNFLNERHRIQRHYYFPPVMSDITEWSNQHHQGHVFANVKHAIRCPGTILCPPYTLNAYYDLRLMKTSGVMYSEIDLMKALYYKEIVGALYQAWFDYCREYQSQLDMTAYDRKWYQQQYTKI
ncbi:hypothetical protein GWK87_07335 [Staphylococcus schleiferi subsp. coagulans]|uniref:hypothetical protein n=1 Tax=Staphylococcus coagulans TaxID=74706 RepID=UPI0015F93236|nr:hypothetical protein [Staphylococcus coagulans]MBA8760103.1 hypothetical protein [Staphylococcus coagulans]MBA8768834.1 hypothetical protein [Staphylococcus coagulans]